VELFAAHKTLTSSHLGLDHLTPAAMMSRVVMIIMLATAAAEVAEMAKQEAAAKLGTLTMEGLASWESSERVSRLNSVAQKAMAEEKHFKEILNKAKPEARYAEDLHKMAIKEVEEAQQKYSAMQAEADRLEVEAKAAQDAAKASLVSNAHTATLKAQQALNTASSERAEAAADYKKKEAEAKSLETQAVEDMKKAEEAIKAEAAAATKAAKANHAEAAKAVLLAEQDYEVKHKKAEELMDRAKAASA